MTCPHMSADEAARLVDEDTERILRQQESHRQYVSVAHDGTTFRGSLEETAEHFGISAKTVKWYASPSGHGAQSESSPRVDMDYRPIRGGFRGRTIEQRMGPHARDVMIRCMTGDLSVSEGARILKVGRSTLSRFMKRIEIDAHRDGSEVTCAYCGKVFRASRTYHKERKHFCSGGCKSAYRRESGADDVERVCVVCGEKFLINKYRKQDKCSSCQLVEGDKEPAHRITRGYGRILRMSQWQQDEIRKCALGKSNIKITADTIMEDEEEVEKLVRIYQEEHKIV